MSSDAGARALAEELGARLAQLKGAGPKVRQFLSMVRFDQSPQRPGALPDGARAIPFKRVRRVIEEDFGARVGDAFTEVDEAPFAIASLGQVHRARTHDGEQVAIKVQHPGVAEAVEADLRNLGIVAPLLRRIAPGLDEHAVLDEIRDRISDELDYEVEAQHQRRVQRLLRGHPHVRVPRVHTELSTRRVLVSEYVAGVRADEAESLADADRDRIGEVAFRCYFGLVWHEGVVAGDPQPEHCILCPDGRLCLLDFALVRDLDTDYLEGEGAVMRALADRDGRRVHDGLARLGYLPEPGSVDGDALLEHLAIAAEWMLAQGERRIDPAYVEQILERAYPPGSPYFGQMRRLSIPRRTLLLRRMEIQVLTLLGELQAAADWGAISAEHHSAAPPSTAIGREAEAFFARRS